MTKNILLIYTGGTIGMVYSNTEKCLVASDIKQIIENIPLDALDINLSIYSFEKPIDSGNMNYHHWQEIAENIYKDYQSYDGFIVLHGTDTMAYTTSALSYMLQGINKPIVFTGSQLPIGSLASDAHTNLLDAFKIATLEDKNNIPLFKEVVLCFHRKVFRGNRITKSDTQNFDGFHSYNCPILAHIGTEININYNEIHNNSKKENEPSNIKLSKINNSNIAIIKVFPNMPKSSLEWIITSKEIKGVILETYGSGNITTESWFTEKLKLLIQKETLIINKTQCNKGYVSMGNYQTSTALKQIGVISAVDMTFEACVTKLMHIISQNLDYKKSIDLFKQCISKEYTLLTKE